MEIDIYITSKQGLPEIVRFESVREAVGYSRRAVKNSSPESPRKITWIGRDSTHHYTPISDWYDAISVLKAL